MAHSSQHKAFALTLHWLPGIYAVCRLAADAPIPAWVNLTGASALTAVTRTDAELSIVVDEAGVPGDVKAERGFVAMRIVGQLDFNLVGVLATLTGALRDAGVPVLAISTFDTDILLVREAHAEAAQAALASVANVAAQQA